MHADYLTHTREATAELSRLLLSSSSLILENMRNDSALFLPSGELEIIPRPAMFIDCTHYVK